MTDRGPGLSAPSPTFTERWTRTPRRWQIVLVLLGALVAGELAASVVSGLTGKSGTATGPSSTFDSSGRGTQAFAQLLSLRGRTVDRITTPLDAATLPAGSTLFALDPAAWNAADTAAVSRLLQRGGRVVLGGRPPGQGTVRTLLGTTSAPAWSSAPVGTAFPVAGGPSLHGVSRVVVPGGGSYRSETASGTGFGPLLTGLGGVLAVAGENHGSLVLLGSSSVLSNEALGQADNAALALDLAGPGTAPVAFDEYDHGFGHPGTGLGGLPRPWRFGLGIALFAVLVWVLSAARRFGPPATKERQMIPARVEHVEALATLLSTRPADELGDVVAPVYREARRRALAGGWIQPITSTCAGSETPTSASANSGESGDELAEALAHPPVDAEQIVEVGRALARVQNGPVAGSRR